jgi:hypothetical protein
MILGRSGLMWSLVRATSELETPVQTVDHRPSPHSSLAGWPLAFPVQGHRRHAPVLWLPTKLTTTRPLGRLWLGCYEQWVAFRREWPRIDQGDA